MTILPSDIKLRESERMTDTPDGGGRRTNRLVVDGVAGNVFPKVSRMDSVYGRVNLRKVYGHVDTQNLDMYAGAHAIITDAPDNDRIHVCAFSTGSDFDLRTAARDRVESYVISGPESTMRLFGRQLVGSAAILTFQRIEEALPEIGEVFALSNEGSGYSTTVQFFRIQSIKDEVRTFTDGNYAAGLYTARILTIGIGSPLRNEYIGLETPARASDAKSVGRVRSTTVADAARYFGIQPLSIAAAVESLIAMVPSVYTPIVPTTQRETGISLASPAGAAVMQRAGYQQRAEEYAGPLSEGAAGVAVMRLMRPAYPGSVSFTQVAVTVFDDGVGGFPPNGPFIGATIDYETGIISMPYGFTFFNTFRPRFTYTPAGAAFQAAHTTAIPITIGTRGIVYTPALLPIPAPGTLFVDYRALGKWYRLKDNGKGELKGGDKAYGTGTVNYVTGGTVITLGALPDVGSQILLSWGSPVHYEIMVTQPGIAAQPASAFTLQLEAGVKPGTVVATWMQGEVTKTATDNATGGMTGHATGTVNYQSGELKLTLAVPIVGTVGVSYAKNTQTVPVPPAEPSFTLNAGGSVMPYSVELRGAKLTLPDGQISGSQLTFYDNGAGLLKCGGSGYVVGEWFNVGLDYWVVTNTTFGTVNYANGDITLAQTIPVLKLRSWVGEEWTPDPAVNCAIIPTLNSFRWALAGAPVLPPPATPVPYPVGLTASGSIGSVGTPDVTAGLNIKLAPLLPLAVVPGSLLFTAFGTEHIDRNGLIYSGVSSVTGSGTVVGAIDYATGQITLNEYPPDIPQNVVVLACLGAKGKFTAQAMSFRTAGSPVRPASTYLQMTAPNGDLQSATTNQNGDFTGVNISAGKIDQSMGVINLVFNTPVMPDTVRYSTVILTNLPLNADILGLDPVRLPSDGRVPIYRPADITVIHHTDIYALGTPVAGSTHSMGREGLSMLWIQDSLGVKLSADLYTTNLDAGTLTMAADAAYTGYALPLSARHRIEEMNLLTDVQINGQLTFAAPLLRTYPMGSFISSAIPFGDLFAHVTGVHDLNTFASFTDVPAQGATAQFNDVDYPIEVLNDAATTERWRLNFISPTSYQVIGEQLGVIATGTVAGDMQPINLLTGKAYFTIRKNGFGAGWSAGNQLRFNTIGATPPFWLVRTVLPGATLQGDSFDAQLRGDVD
jgi:hypothetical protein